MMRDVRRTRSPIELALSELARLPKTPPPSPSGNQRVATIYGRYVGGFYFQLGKLKEAERFIGYVHREPRRNAAFARVASARGDLNAVRTHLKRSVTSDRFTVGDIELLVQARLLAEARRAISLMEERWTDAALALARAYLASAEGKSEEATKLFRQSLSAAGVEMPYVQNRAAYQLADLLAEQGKPKEAIDVLRPLSGLRSRAFVVGYGHDWMRAQWRLAQLYRKAGQTSEAEKIEAELRRLLAYADPDHAILLQLKRAQDLALAQSSK